MLSSLIVMVVGSILSGDSGFEGNLSGVIEIADADRVTGRAAGTGTGAEVEPEGIDLDGIEGTEFNDVRG